MKRKEETVVEEVLEEIEETTIEQTEQKEESQTSEKTETKEDEIKEEVKEDPENEENVIIVKEEKPTLFVSFKDFCSKSGEDWKKEYASKYGKEPLRVLKISNKTGRDVIDRAGKLLKQEGLDGQGVELGEE